METDQDKLDAAYKQGALDQRLDGYDIHFAAINGSIERTAVELKNLSALIEGQLTGKADRDSVHNLRSEVAAANLKMVTLEQTVVMREGPIMERIDKNAGRLDTLEANHPVMMLKMKDEFSEELKSLRDALLETRFSGSLRRSAAGGSGFAVTITVVLGLAHAAGLL